MNRSQNQQDRWPILDLPTDHHRYSQSEAQAQVEHFVVETELFQQARAFADRTSTSVEQVFLSVWLVLLARYSGQSELVSGVKDGDVLLLDLIGDESFADLLQRVALADMATVEQVPQVGFQVPAGLTNGMELAVQFREEASGAAFEIHYDGHLFKVDTIRRMGGHLLTLLSSGVTEPSKRISHLPLLTATELQKVLVEWPDAPADYPREQPLYRLFEAQVAQTPDAVALIDGEFRLTYRELERRANRLARYLQREGVAVGQAVGLCVERSFDMIVGMLAILKAGAGYVPLDPDYPQDRLNFMLSDAHVAVLVTTSQMAERLSCSAGRQILLDAEVKQIDEMNDEPLLDTSDASGLAYIIYTSGSTGLPKGVCVPHRGVVRLVKGTNYLSADAKEVFLQFAPISFDAAMFEIWGSLLNGAQLVLFPPGKPSMEELGRVLVQHRVSVAFLTSSVFNQMVDDNLSDLSFLRQMMVGGEAMSVAHAKRAIAALPDCQLINIYGPTECTVFASFYFVRSDEEIGTSIPIGRPIHNTSLYVLDQNLQPVPIGVPGELYIGGDGVAIEYLNRPELNEQRFIANPYAGGPNQRLYKSGDLVRYLEDGNIDYIGRLDDQVKVRGFRIELGEIEMALSQHPAIEKTTVLVREDQPGDRRLVAYFVTRSETLLTVGELRQFLGGKLPEYMMPSAFVQMDQFPLTQNGKVDRRLLPAPDRDRPELSTDYAAPRDELELQVADIWSQILQVEQIGVDDNFFELGGHSLQVAKIITRVRDRLGVELMPGHVMNAGTIARLAEVIRALLAQSKAPAMPALTTADRDQELPLSFAQQRLWFLDQMHPGHAVYNVPVALRIRGLLDVPTLEASLREILRRHESLRTYFPSQGGQPRQMIAVGEPLDLSVSDLSGEPVEEREARLQQVIEREAQHPFDLAAGPLFRVLLVRVVSDEHVLLLTMHHTITDGWSLGVLIDELRTLYGAFAVGEPSPLAELPCQYADYSYWQRQWLHGEIEEQQLAYWRERLSGEVPVLQLPTDFPKQSVQDYAGQLKRYQLPEQLVADLKRLSKREGVTLYMTLLAAFKTLLMRYTGQEDILIGTPVANRNRSELEGLIGFFVNTLTLRTDLSGSPSFRELLGRVKETALSGYAHQDVPFEKVVEALQPERALGQTPFFQVMFAMESDTIPKVDVAGLRMEPITQHNRTAMFDLTLTMHDDTEGLTAALEYREDLFAESTIFRMLDHFRALLEAAVSEPNRPITQLNLLTGAERQVLLEEWNDTAEDVPLDRTVYELFEEQAARTPDAEALVVADQRLTYRELNERSNRLAQHLSQRGVRPGVLVGICLDRSVDLIVGLLGILKAGGAYVPLDLAYPQERLAFMIEDTQFSVLLTEGRLLPQLPAHQATAVLVDVECAQIAEQSGANLKSGATADHPAYVIYTSGSTGKPKGVVLPHRSLVNHNLGIVRQFALKECDQVLEFTSISFDNAAEEIYPTLICGATLVLSTQRVPSYAELQELIEKERLTVLNLPTAYWSEWVYELEAVGERVPTALRLMVVGGEKVTMDRYRAWQQVAGQEVQFMHAYGLTETTITSTFYTALAEETHAELPIGRPIVNTQIYVLDAAMNPVPVGVPGELYIGGNCLASGYLHRPDLTAEKFIPHPFVEGALLYKTGDLVRYLPDGNLDFMGRIDQQVKIRGYRIELGEITEVLTLHENVRHAVVIVREDLPRVKRIVAYVVPDRPVTASELNGYLKGKLPEYMVPSAYVMLDELPLAPTGKIDRKALPAPDSYGTVEERDLDAAHTQTEELVNGIFARVLGMERVGLHENFFDLGGHSLLATQVISRVREIFQVQLPLRVFFEAPTVVGLARRVEEAVRLESGLREVPPIQPIPRDGKDIPLSFAQQRLWFLDQLEPNSAVYNMIDVVRLSGPLDVEALHGSLNEIVRRHEALRTVFAEVDGQPVQRIHAAETLDLPVIDLQDEMADQREEVAMKVCKREAQIPFDLTQDLLIRASLLRLDEHLHMLVLTTHHIVNDGWSVGVFFQELAVLYAALSAGQSSPLPELPIQYADFAVWQREWMQGEVLDEQLAYWKQHLSGELPVLQLPTDRPRSVKPTHKGAIHNLTIPAQLTEQVKRLSKTEGASLFMTLLAAFETLLYRYTGQEDLIVGSAIANRNREDIEDLIGFFVNTLALRNDLSGNPSFRELISRVREVALGAYAHQDLPFEKLVEELQPDRDLSQSPLFRVLFVLQNAPMDVLELSNLSLQLLAVDNETAKFDLTLSLLESEGKLVGELEYNADLFDASTVARIAKHYERLLEGAVADPVQPISSIPLLSETEQDLLIETWNETATDYPRESTIAKLFADQAALTPERVAVTFGSEHLSYREVDEQSNRLAHYLQKQGVAASALVGICMERSVEMIVGMLGILKAGGAYVPLDPSYPQDRLTYMIEDTQLPILLTQESLVERLPAHQARVICLDSDWQEIAAASSDPVQSSATAEDLAYVIYTSGSTGKPKGVCVPHRGVVRLVKETDFADFTPEHVFLQLAPISFDAATFEIWGSLLNGARLAVYPPSKPSLEELGKVVRSEGVTTLWLTAGLFHLVAEGELDNYRSLRQLLAGGDVLSASHVAKVLRELPGCRVINGYGPTENTTFTCCHPLTDADQVGLTVPIGRPIANTRVYVLDGEMRPVPVGVPGELYIAGDGLAHGYLNRPDLTEERFLPDPFANEPVDRMYKSGDLVRYAPDGTLEFLGRIDQQVKIRGYRIELGEIEAVLAQHPNVRETAVLAREEENGEKRLVAYVVPADAQVVETLNEMGDEWNEEQVFHWEMLFDEYYNTQSATTDDNTFNIVGWNSSYTGQPIPAEEMREWLDHTIGRINSLNTDRVLEIGCGTGMLLYRVAPNSESYWGTDISAGVLDSLRNQLAETELARKVTLLHRQAEQFDGILGESFDLVIMNSVVQYFPSIEYLLQVLSNAVHVVEEGGTIFLGDLRSLPLLDTFHTAVELYRASDELTLEQLEQRIRLRNAKDNELVISPDFFYALKEHLPQITEVEVLLKPGKAHNELTQFRYDVILHVGTLSAEQRVVNFADVREFDWNADRLSINGLREMLMESSPEQVLLRNVPDARLQGAVRARCLLASDERPQTVGELRAAISQEPFDSVEPDELFALSESVQYAIRITRSTLSAEGAFDAILTRLHAGEESVRAQTSCLYPAVDRLPWHQYSNRPLRTTLERNLIPEYCNFLEQRLPDFMVPSAFVILDKMPLTPNGKVDRRALPAPDKTLVQQAGEYEPPVTPVEEAVAEIWADILGYEQVGIHDNFFLLGGHSLMATQVVSRLRDAFEIELPLHRMFEMPTIAELALVIEEIILAEVDEMSEEEAAQLLGLSE